MCGVEEDVVWGWWMAGYMCVVSERLYVKQEGKEREREREAVLL